MRRVIWRAHEPESARFARNWLHEKWLQFRLGWPASRVTTLHLRRSTDSPETMAPEYAAIFEQILR